MKAINFDTTISLAACLEGGITIYVSLGDSDLRPVTFSVNELIDTELEYNAIPNKPCTDPAVYDTIETLFEDGLRLVRKRRKEALGE